MGLHPIEVTDQIGLSYTRYLMTAFHMKDRHLLDQLRNELQRTQKFVKGPYLEITAPYKQSHSLKDLVDEGLISSLLQNLNQEDLPFTRLLYHHQELAVRKITNGRNVVVATGTGSGKTESFLIPILNHLYREKEQGVLTHGVRALLVYPMNALANDQVNRLRSLLKHCPDITFGRYTGETEETTEKAEETFKLQNGGKKSLKNELLSREEMRKTPPHILITNYAMLEYLLLRPQDNELFDGHHANHWKFIVLDEAHTYSGATGIEVAMLLRRLKDRVLQSHPLHGSIQSIATSATLGTGHDAIQKVMKFASDLFDETFEWDPVDVAKQDFVTAERVNYGQIIQPWSEPYPEAYEFLASWSKSRESGSLSPEQLRKYSFPEGVIEKVTEAEHPEQVLYACLEGDKQLAQLRESLKEKPRVLTELASELFPSRPDAQDILTNLVDVSVRAKAHNEDLPLLPARYHLFVRAIEGAYLSFLPTRKIYLDSRKTITDGQQTYAVFELGVCSSCGQEHLIGEEDNGKLVQRKGLDPDPDKRFNAYMIVDSAVHTTPPDEDEEVLSGEETDLDEKTYTLCPACGDIKPAGAQTKEPCCEQAKHVRRSTLIKETIVRNHHATCHYCGAKHANPIRLFISGQDAATSVLSTSLYQELVRSSADKGEQNSLRLDQDDVFKFLNEVSATSESSVEETYSPQKLLVFSDSRQDAAFFATYLDRTYQQFAWRRLMVEALTELEDENEISLDDLVLPIVRHADRGGFFDTHDSHLKKRQVVMTHLMHDFLLFNRRISPEGVGLLSFECAMPPEVQKSLSQLAGVFGVQPADFWKTVQNIFDSLRSFGAVQFPANVDPSDRVFAPRNRVQYVNFNQSVSRFGVSSWLPSQGKINRRLDYLTRLYEKQGLSAEDALAKAEKSLENLWKLFTTHIKGFLVPTVHSEAGAVFQLSYEPWRIHTTGQSWYQCTHCGYWTTRNVSGVCPTMRCQGELQPGSPADVADWNHYYRLYTGLIPIRMITKEHTAQLSAPQAARYQQEFVQSAINVLSCSTTFEMGVDVGGLEAVFMRNVPPETANYIQRAGRAGRRRSTTAFALTYAQRRSHDLAYFQRPESIIAGEVRPPLIHLQNEKIVRRHMHSVALAAFFRTAPDYFRTVENFFRVDQTEDRRSRGTVLIRAFLQKEPDGVLQSLRRVVPESMQSRLGVSTWGWTRDFISEDDGVLSKAEGLYERDLTELHRIYQENHEQRKDNRYTLGMIQTLKDKQLLAYLSSNNVLPKYGFPVDVVELQITNKDSHQISLARDLKLAISEYAPGAEVIADGKLWRSVGVKRVSKYELPYYQYGYCKRCGNYSIVARYQKEPLAQTPLCDICMNPLSVRPFIVPMFGFVSARESGSPGEHRPEKLFSSRVFFSDYDGDREAEQDFTGETRQGDTVIEWRYSPRGKLAIVNSGTMQGYQICKECGVERQQTRVTKSAIHRTPWGSPCSGHFESVHLGHEFMSDVMEMTFHHLPIPQGVTSDSFWISLLYGLLEGTSSCLGIDRDDIDGCLYYRGSSHPSIIIFDNVPGGAGYTREMQFHLSEILKETLRRMEQCTCGPETSCYGCLRSYRNQFCHDLLIRGAVVDCLDRLMR